jgi:hypothetical protein
MAHLSSAPQPGVRSQSVLSVVTWPIWLPWLACAALLLCATRTDPDLWGHVRFGLDWIRTRTLPIADPYSFTQDRPWTNHEWLSEVFMAAAYLSGGSAGLVLMKLAVLGPAVAIVGRRAQGATALVRATLMLLAIVGGLPLSGTVRPQLWSLLGLVLVAGLLDGNRPTIRRMVFAAVLFGLWANLHGGWITGAAALALHACIRGIRAPADRRSWLALGLVSLGATLLNPYGIGLWAFLATTVRAARPDVSEWQPFSLAEPPIMWVSVAAPVILMVLLARRRATRPPLESCAVVLLLVFAGLRVSRVAPLICPAALAILAPHVAAAWGSFGGWRAPGTAAALILLSPGVFAGLAASGPIVGVMRCLPIHDTWAPDLSAAPQLRGLSGRLWVTFDWGEFAIWHFGPALRVSIDGRRETVYSNDIIQWHRAVERADEMALDRLLLSRPEYIWLPASRQATRDWLAAHEYRIDLQTSESFVAVRADLPPLSLTAPPFAPCFPGR